jgi:hypothetical protein
MELEAIKQNFLKQTKTITRHTFFGNEKQQSQIFKPTVIDLKRTIKQGGVDEILWLSVTCAPIDILQPIKRLATYK